MAVIEAKIRMDIKQAVDNLQKVQQKLEQIKEYVIKPKIGSNIEGEINNLKNNIQSSLENLKVKPNIENFANEGQKAGSSFVERFQANLNKLSSSFSTIGTNLRNQLSASISSISSIMEKASSMVFAYGIVQIAGGLKSLAKEAIETSANLEQTTIAFQTLVGNIDYANALLKEIKLFSAKTPFEFGDIAKAAQVMMSFSIPAEQVMENIKMIGDISAGNKQKFEALTLAFSQVASTGRLMGQDLLQMINAGFNPLMVISEKTGKSIAVLKKEMEEGKISFEMVKEAFRTATSEGGQFYGMMEKQSQSFLGLVSTLKDNLKTLLVTISEGAFIKLKEQLSKVIEVVQRVSSAFQKGGLKEALKQIFSESQAKILYASLVAIKDVVSWLVTTLKNLLPILLPIAGVISVVMGIVKAITILKVAWAGLNAIMAANPILAIIGAIGLVVTLIYTYWSEIKNFFQGVWDWLKNLFVIIKEAISNFISEVVNIGKYVLNAILLILNPVGGIIFGILTGNFKEAYNFIDNITGGLLTKLVNKFKSFVEEVRNFVNNIINAFSKWWKSVEEKGGLIGTIFQKLRLFAEDVANAVVKIFQTLISWLQQAYEWVKKGIEWIKGLFGGGEEVKIQSKVETKVEAKIETKEAQNEWNAFVTKVQSQMKSAFDSQQKISANTISLWREEANKLVLAGKVSKEQAEQFLDYIEKRNEKIKVSTTTINQNTEAVKKNKEEWEKWLEKIREIEKTSQEKSFKIEKERRKEELETRLKIINSQIEELKKQEQILENTGLLISLFQNRLEIEKEILKIEAESEITGKRIQYEDQIENLKKYQKEVIESENLNAKQRKEINQKLNAEIQKQNENLAKEIELLQYRYNSKQIELEEKTTKEILEIQNKAKNQRKKQIEEEIKATENSLRQLASLMEKISQIGEIEIRKEKNVNNIKEYKKEYEELQRSLVKGKITEMEYYEKLNELEERRREEIRKTKEEQLTYISSFGASFTQIYITLLNQNRRWLEETSQLFLNISKDAEKFGLSFEAIFEHLTSKSQLFFEYFSVMFTQNFANLIQKGLPLFEAFKISFLTTLIDMVEKTVLAYLPLILAKIQATIPFPFSTILASSITATIVAGLELAKAKIRGAEKGYMKGFKEGSKGASDTLLIWINPNEVILPTDVVAKNRETLKLMLQGLSFDKQRKEILPTLAPQKQTIKIETNFDFQPLRLYSNDIMFKIQKISEKKIKLRR